MKIRAENAFLLALVVITSIYGADTTKFVYTDFSDLSSWQVNGGSAGATNTDDKKVLRLTVSKDYQSGSAFIKESQKLVSDKGFLASFSAYFSFQITKNDGLKESDGTGADGIAFVVQTVANNVGTTGQGLGFEGIERSLGIEFDTWENGDTVGDPNGNHAGIDINGNIRSIKTLNEKTRFNNGAIWYAWVDYDGDNQNLEVRYDTVDVRPAQPKLTSKINLPGLLVQENAYVGFTSATGGAYSIHDILSFKFINRFQPFGYRISISATPDTIVNVSDSVHLLATVYNANDIIQPDSAKNTEWSVISNVGNPSSVLKSKKGSEVLLIPEVDSSQIKIQAKVIVNNQLLVDTITIYVKAKLNESLFLSINPDTLVSVYDSVHLVASIRDSKNSSQPDLAQKTKWTIIDAGGNPSGILKSDLGANVLLIPEIAFSQVKIEARAAVNNQILIDTVTISVKAGVPYKLVIESAPVTNDTSLLRHTKPVDIITLNSIDSAFVYAVVRDKWGNYCRMADSIKTLWSVINGSKVVSATGIEQKKYKGKIKSAGVGGDASVEASESGLIKDTLTVKIKGGGPSLIRAVYTPSSGSNKGVLQLTFSEPVDLDMLLKTLPQTALKYFSSQGVSSTVILAGSTFNSKASEQFGATVTIQLGSGESGIIPDKDSVQLISGTVNKQGEIPNVISGGKVLVEMANGTISITISSNPVKLDKDLSSTLPPRILNTYKNVIGGNAKGMIIAVHSTVPLKEFNGNWGTAVVYDAVGNLVVKDLEILKANDNSLTEYGAFWDGKNRNGRTVGAGTYLLVISITDIKGVTRSLRSKIGIAQL